MAKILGLPFDDYVDKQITVRQTKLAKYQKDPEDLVVFNANTSWVRLSSAVKIDAARAQTLSTTLGISPSQIQGTKLPQNLVLFGGTTPYPLGTQGEYRGGIGYGLNNNYGFLTETSQGLKPMPGITQISVTSKNNGSLKQAQVSLKCFSRAQFEAIEAVYLRLGFTMALEWGHSVWFDNTGNIENTTLSIMPDLLFTSDNDIPPDTAIQKIQKWRRERAGNYDGMVARVSNYSWTLNDDLTFDIKLDLISVGDLIDSLKANIGATGSPVKVDVAVSASIQNLVTIQANQNTSKLNRFLYELWDQVFSPLIQEFGSEEEKQAVETANETTQAVTATQTKIQNTWIPALNEIRKYGEVWVTGYQVAQEYKQQNPQGGVPLTADQIQRLDSVVNLFQTATTGPKNTNAALNQYFTTSAIRATTGPVVLSNTALELQEDELKVANDFIAAVNEIQNYLNSTSNEGITNAPDLFNTLIGSANPRDSIIRGLDIGFLDKDEKLKLPDRAKFETGFDSTVFAKSIEELLKYDGTDNLNV